jgi:hypothetical protein
MADLFVGSENDSYYLLGHHVQSASVTSLFRGTASPDIDTNFSQNGVGPYNNAHLVIDIAGTTELWFHCLVNFRGNSTTALFVPIKFIDTASGAFPGQVVAQLDPDLGVAPYNGTSVFDLEYWDGAAFQACAGRGADRRSIRFATGCRQKIDIHIKIDNVAGWFRFYVDGVLRQEFTGDTLNAGYTQINRIILHTNVSPDLGSASATVYTEVIVSQDDTRGRRVANLEPTADGANTAWGGAIAEINDDALRDTEFISSTTANQVETYVTSDLSAVADNLYVMSIVTNARAKIGNLGTGPQNLQHVVRSNSVDYFSANVTRPNGGALDARTGPTQAIWLVDPNTSAAWATAAVNAMQIGVKSIA